MFTDDVITDLSNQPSLSQTLGASSVQIERAADIPIHRSFVSIRTFNCLMREQIKTIGMLLAASEEDLSDIHNLGDKSIDEIKSMLRELLASSPCTLPHEVGSQVMCPPSLGNVLGYSREDIQKVADLPVGELVLSQRALGCLKIRQFNTVSQLLSIGQSDLRHEYQLSDKVVTQIKACLKNLLHEIERQKEEKKQLTATWDDLKRESLQSNLQLFWSIPAFLKRWNASTKIDGNEEEALQKRRQLRNAAIGREYTLDVVLDACRELCGEREWAIITARCGLTSNGQRKTLNEIAKVMQLSRERIRQQENNLLTKTRNAGGIIDALHESLVWVFERNEGVLNMERAAAELQKYFSPGEASFVNMCLLLCKAFPEFNLIVGADRQKVRDAMQPAERPLYALGNKAENFVNVIKAARKLWTNRESPIKSEGWSGQVVNALNENGCQLDAHYVLACLRADGRFDPSRFDTIDKVPTLTCGLVETLQRIGAPAHFTEICEKLNQYELLNRVTPSNSALTCLGFHSELFACVGTGTYGLVSWGLADQRITRDHSILIADAIEAFLEKSGEPVHKKHIVSYVMQQKRCRYSSVSQLLANDPKFRRMALGIYGLSKWYSVDDAPVILPTIKERVVDVLNRMGTPASVADISAQINKDQPAYQAIARTSVNGCLNTQHDLFVRVGLGIYGLASWGLEDIRPTRDGSASIGDIVESFLEMHNKPAALQEIADYVLQQRQCSAHAVSGALSRDSRFRRTRRAVYGLERWLF